MVTFIIIRQFKNKINRKRLLKNFYIFLKLLKIKENNAFENRYIIQIYTYFFLRISVSLRTDLNVKI